MARDPRPPAERVRDRLRAAAGDAVARTMPPGFQRLGRVLVLRLPLSLRPHFDLLGEAWRSELGVATVLVRTGPIEGELRRPRCERIAGEGTETEVVEHGVRWRFDAARIMFAAGNRTERVRAGKLVRPGESVADLFAGIGYFAIPAALSGSATRVVAVEKNPVAHRYLVENATLNGVADRLRAVEGDNRDELLPLRSFDRVFLGYLPSAIPWVGRAVGLLRLRGGWVHVHTVQDSRAALRSAIEEVETTVRSAGGRTLGPTRARAVKPYGPGRTHVVVDARVEPPRSSSGRPGSGPRARAPIRGTPARNVRCRRGGWRTRPERSSSRASGTGSSPRGRRRRADGGAPPAAARAATPVAAMSITVMFARERGHRDRGARHVRRDRPDPTVVLAGLTHDLADPRGLRPQRGAGRDLGENVDPEVVGVVARDLREQLRPGEQTPEAEAGQPAVLGDRPDGHRLLGSELPREGVPFGEVAVGDVVEQEEVVVVGDLRDGTDLLAGVPRAERVQRVDEKDHPGLGCDGLAHPVGREAVRRRVDVEVDGAGAGELDEPVDDEVARVGGDHLVARLEERPREHVERLGATAREERGHAVEAEVRAH